MAEEHTAQSQPFNDCAVLVQKQNGENRFKLSDDQPLLRNAYIGLNPNNVVDPEITSPINPNNAVINETLKNQILDEVALTEVVLDRCEGSVTSNKLAHDISSEPGPKQINESHASHAHIRVLKQDGQRRILPTWTCRVKSPNHNVAVSGECSSGKKREIRVLEDHSEFPPKCF